ncbi:hypothetical protein L227DRAFT_572349 [Lentinus tigrinus ALCF2SS1-6]|uniref:Transcriptional activator HAP2 n=1 Tax=Lentinus tigrinus ALCF2SS1-6 TaxID=1328759 RepID=A0A5C2SJI5_9APHY|nr:hypothetical protein L227DRAFT_572349 [Lentinus tigrinus ALCF2SS1-6]
MRRPRGPGGRFLTAEEIAAQKAQQEAEVVPSGSASIDGDGEDDDDAMGEASKDADMAVDSPIAPPKPATAPAPVQMQPPPHSQQPDKLPDIRPPAVTPGQPLLQPRPHAAASALQPQPQLQPQAQIQTHPPASMVTQPQPTPQTKPQPSPMPPAPVQSPHPPPPAHSPFNIQLGHNPGAVNLLNVGFPSSMSHPATPAPLSPHSDAMNPFDHVPTPDPYSRPLPPRPMPGMHTHSHAGQPGQAAHTHSHAGQPGQAAHMHGGQPGMAVAAAQSPPPATNQPSMSLRAPYHAAMQMHHVPHPHAHARHHATFINRSERLYGSGPADHAVMNISAEGIKGDMQRRGSDLMRGFGNASNAK